MTLKATVKNGRLILDEPTDRREGEIVELVPVDEIATYDPVAEAIANAPYDDEPMTEQERIAIEEVRSGRARLIPHAEVKKKLADRTR